ncbi:MAG TPA: amylo-alpha-1,6-glucosidase [Vicinamibacterales bacterium]|nr:amylo-alpha-1,6-glucosidase [Vicinamibacterales bacterium]
MQHVIRLTDQFDIAADPERPSTPPRVLKHGDTFSVFDQRGDMIQSDTGEQGLFFDGTRFLSRCELLVGPGRPLLLSSTISDDNVVFTADLTNADVRTGGRLVMPHGEIHVFRSRLLYEGGCVERLRVSNYALHAVELPLKVRYDADFADIFEVRGTRRPHRGERLPESREPHTVLRYRGLDGLERRTRLRWSAPPDDVGPGVAMFLLRLEPHGTIALELSVSCERGAESRTVPSYDDVLLVARETRTRLSAQGSRLLTTNERLDRWVRRSTADLEMMMTDTPSGIYPYAGIPWFSCPFGRDGIITAFELLWANPSVARGVLGYLAEMQATVRSDAQDAQPGKILHELRGGEMAALGEVPFGRYYGTVDATPLFIMLADAYAERTADLEFIDRLWPSITAAARWMEDGGDLDDDGLIEYARRSETGLVQQGWKDSQDSVFHQDGTLAEGPIALCEVQGYAFAAWRGGARLAALRGDNATAAGWQARAERVRARFEDAFWCEDLGTYALALDGDKRPCRVRTSNPGHCLFAGIVSPERARSVAESLMGEGSFSGWGVRTVAAGESRYNPMSYHNGSVWPHDNAIVAAGLARYGFTGAAARILDAMFSLSQVVDLHRLPELICGFHRRGGEYPTLYPVACAPQAWAAGAVYLLLQASLGLRVDAGARSVSFSRAVLPGSIDSLQITNLQVGDAVIDLLFERHPHDVGVRVLRRTGDVEIVAVK